MLLNPLRILASTVVCHIEKYLNKTKYNTMRNFLFALLMLVVLGSCKKNESESTIVYQDNLTIDKMTWPSDSTSVHIRKFYQGHYFLEVDSVPNIISYSFAPFGTLNYPYSVQVDAILQINNSNEIGFVGIIFNRVDKNNYCVVELCSNSTYRIWKRTNGSITNILTSTYSSIINTDNSAKNTIKVIQGSSSIQLFINNASLGSFNLSIPNVYFQVGVSTSTYLVPVIGLFNNFIIEKI